MEFYLTKIQAHLTYTDLKSALTSILHSEAVSGVERGAGPPRAPMNFIVDIWRNQGRGGNPLLRASLRIPILETARRFVEFVGGEFLVEGHPVRVDVSKKDVKQDVFDRILAEEFVTAQEEERRRKALKATEVPVKVERVATGHLWGNVFRCELEIEEEGETSHVFFDNEKRSMEIVVGMAERLEDYTFANPTTISIALDSIASFSSLDPLPKILAAPVLLSLFRPPIMSSAKPFSDGDDSLRERHATLPGHTSLAPILNLLITFSDEPTRKSFLDKAPGSKLPPLVVTSSVEIVRLAEVDMERREREARELEEFLKTLDFPIAFQIELLLRNGILNVEQVLYLVDEIKVLVDELDVAGAEKVLQVFGSKIIRSTGIVEGMVDDGGEIWEKWEEHEDQKVRLPQHLKDVDRIKDIKESREDATAVNDTDHRRKVSENIQLLLFLNALKTQIPEAISSGKSRLRPGEAITRLVLVTATSYSLSGPTVDESNSVLRRFPGNEHSFIRVSIREEDFSRYRSDRATDLAQFLNDRYLSIFKTGLPLGGRTFDFLGYSGSALKDHSAWFVTPFTTPHATLVSAASIRASLGDFTKVIHIPARYMARVSQAFTSTKPSVTLQSEQIRMIPDREKEWMGSTTCFTDGVGTISEALAREVEVALTRGIGKAGRKRRGKPTTYQIRLGGSKGMVGIDPALRGSVICLRPSMTKFDAPDSLTLDIASSFTRPLPAMLNRPLIKILEDLGIPAVRFLKLQRDAVAATGQARHDPLVASRLFNRMKLGESTNFGSTFKTIQKEYGLNMLGEDAFVSECTELAMVQSLRDLKSKARIPLPDSYNLVGIADESPNGGYLKEGKIYAAIKKPGSNETIYLEGLVAISRSPSMHPGDIQVVRAIGRLRDGEAPALSIHTNTVVFSVRGERSLPSCLGGGDLDGDLYLLITDPDLIPSLGMIAKPSKYDPVEMVRLDRPCTIEDGAEFFLKYVLSDIVGLIATQHLLIADQAADGTFNKDCLALADLHSQAVDYAKSGKAVPATDMPRPHNPSKPDFMSPPVNRSYASSKALGKLYRDIGPKELELRSFTPLGDPASQSLDPDRSLTTSIATTPLQHYPRGLGGLDIPDALRNFVQQQLMSYAEDLYAIGQQNAYARRSDRHLTEAEVFLGTILDRSSMKKAADKDTVEKLHLQTVSHFETYENLLTGGEGTSKQEQAFRAYAGWIVALESDQREYGVQSFAWMAMSILLELMQELAENDETEVIIID